MNKTFHQTAPIIALKMMPENFQAFLISGEYTIQNLQTDADIPDLVDKDNITQNAEIHHAHSYKLEFQEGKLHWIDGDCLERIKAICADIHDFYKENKLDMVRYSLAKVTHYRIDALTYPHLHQGKPWSLYHTKFEDEIGEFIYHNQDKIKQIKFQPYKHIYKECRKTAIQMWYEGKNIVEKYENNIRLTDEEKLSICNKCIESVGDLWITLMQELKFKE